ncbi:MULTISPECIES: efflux RND transporter periplasmic adaptor subunit [unclassified Bradyrhizobium]|uniref:efflux RND transporter periplasmic adaptor subunit n=1 Tax=unclassified Bradyrhizobium TaxID=2631580 RepID=UPI0004121E70|nr:MULTISPECIES: efflux RND transporter periplasmic adaptor subunit [unclassified Bradyrhizobium]QIG92640.1 efflux RND transporter periplasmic adaptor subunit [Bradyrhizobium sp. 6(2017)]
MKRIILFFAGVAAGIALVVLAAGWIGWPVQFPATTQETATAGTAKAEAKHEAAGHIELSEDQIRDAAITLAQTSGGMLKRHFLAPGSMIPDADHIGRVSVRVLATVTELRKRLGDVVEKGEIVAAIESREVADAKSEYLAARLTNDLRQTLYARQKTLVETRVVSENEFLRTRLTANDAQIKLDGARQKLFALGLSESEIADLPNQPPESLRTQFLRSPISGRVSERRVDLGGLIGREGQESELYVIVNLDDVWVDLAVSPEDIAAVREGLSVKIRAIGTEDETSADVIFVSPLLDRDTRNARVIATLPNKDHRWKPGTFVTAEVPLGDAPSTVIVSKKAIQTIKGTPTVFVRDADGFEARSVRTGREDDDDIEIVAGLSAGETIAVQNTFTLKAEIEKDEAEHDHD